MKARPPCSRAPRKERTRTSDLQERASDVRGENSDLKGKSFHLLGKNLDVREKVFNV